MGECPLNENERLVLYGIVRHPGLSDKELADRLGLKQSTVTSIRRRLNRQRYFFSITRVPNLARLGAELITVTSMIFDPSLSNDKRLRVMERLAREQDEVVWSISEPGQSVTVQIARSYTDVKRNIDEMEEQFTSHDIIGKTGIVSRTFPLELCDRLVMFDFAPLLRHYFEIDLEADVSGGGWAFADLKNGGTGAPDFTKTEREVFLGLVQHPALSDIELSEKIDVSRYTIGRLRNRFEEDGLIERHYIPDLLKLGFELMVFGHAKFNLRIPPKERTDVIDSLLDIQPSIFVVKNHVECATIDVYKDFEDFRRTVGRFNTIYQERGLFTDQPDRLLFSIPVNKTVKEYEYLPITQKVMG